MKAKMSAAKIAYEAGGIISCLALGYGLIQAIDPDPIAWIPPVLTAPLIILGVIGLYAFRTRN